MTLGLARIAKVCENVGNGITFPLRKAGQAGKVVGNDFMNHKVTYGVGIGITAVFGLAAIALVALPACGVDISSVTDAAKDLANGTVDGAGSFLEAHSVELLAGGGAVAGIATIALTRLAQKGLKDSAIAHLAHMIEGR